MRKFVWSFAVEKCHKKILPSPSTSFILRNQLNFLIQYNPMYIAVRHNTLWNTTQKMKILIKDFLSKCDQIRRGHVYWSKCLWKTSFFVQCNRWNPIYKKTDIHQVSDINTMQHLTFINYVIQCHQSFCSLH